MAKRLCFVDESGGSLAALAAGVARAAGHLDAIATTTANAIRVAPEVEVALTEIGGHAAEVTPVAEAPLEGVEHVRVGRGVPGWDVWLYEKEGDLERMSAARIARDRIERKLDPRPIPSGLV
jgi:hypothetical protein